MTLNTKNLSATIIYVILILTIILTMKSCIDNGGLCFGICERYDIVREYSPEKSELKIATPYEINGDERKVVHTYNLGQLQRLQVYAFDYDVINGTNDHGQDTKLFYLTPEKYKIYNDTYLKTNTECPAAWMVQNMNIYILVGLNDEITEELRNYRLPEDVHKGITLTYSGHVINYTSSIVDGKEQWQLNPSKNESSISNVGSAQIPYTYFLVTEIGQ